MITNKKLKIWTMVSHGLILVGAGHGVMVLLVIEIFFLPFIKENSLNFSFDAENHFSVVSLMMLLGQAAMITSILSSRQPVKCILQIVSISLLWIGIIYFHYDTTRNHTIHIASITAIPFAVCTVITFIGRPLKKLYNWIRE